MLGILSNVGMMVTSINRPSFTCFSSLRHSAAGSATKNITGPPPLHNQHSPISTTRRSGNYEPTMWDFQFIHSLHNHYAGDKYMTRLNELKKEMKKKLMVMEEGSQELEKLELIDNLERLGVSYHFKNEITQILRSIHQNTAPGYSLYTTALKFRLLRQHGFHISQDIFNNFKDENGNVKQSICKDTKGLLELYEASRFSQQKMKLAV